MNNKLTILAIAVISLSFISIGAFAFCNFNNVSEPSLGETVFNCPEDFVVKISCGNGYCDYNETGETCPQDCLPAGISNHAPVFQNLSMINESSTLSFPANTYKISDKSFIINEGQTLKFVVNATDQDGNYLTYRATSLPTGSSFDIETKIFSWTPRFDTVVQGTSADFTIYFRVYDNYDEAKMPITITVKDATITANPPAAYLTNDGPKAAGSVFNLTVNVTDSDNDPVQFRFDFEADGIWDTEWNTSTNNHIYQTSHIYYSSSKAVVAVKDSAGFLLFASTDVNILNASAPGNHIPIATNVTVVPANPPYGTNFVCNYTYFDADNDEEKGTIFRWFRNGIEYGGLRNSAVYGKYAQPGDNWQCEVTPRDGKDFGRSVLSSISAVVGPAPVSTGGGGGGSSSGGYSGSGNYGAGTVIIPGIQSGTPYNIDIQGNSAISNLILTTKENVYYVSINVDKLNGAPSGTTQLNNVYQYLQIIATNLTDDKISKAFVLYKVDKNWLNSRGFAQNSVALERFEGGSWKILPTEKMSEDNSYVYYKSKTPGFSYFAIVGGETNVPMIPTDGSVETTTTTTSQQITSNQSTTPTTGSSTSSGSGFNVWMPIVIFLIIIFLIIIALVIRSRGKRRIPE